MKSLFWDNSGICLLLVVNNDKCLTHVVDNTIFGSNVPYHPSYPWKQLSTIVLEFQYILFTYIHINYIKFTYVKFNTAKFRFIYSICFFQVWLKLFTLLINTADKEIYNMYQYFSIPLILYYWINKHTHKQTNTHNNRVLALHLEGNSLTEIR